MKRRRTHSICSGLLLLSGNLELHDIELVRTADDFSVFHEAVRHRLDLEVLSVLLEEFREHGNLFFSVSDVSDGAFVYDAIVVGHVQFPAV